MDKKKIIKEYKNKIKLINKYNKFYYEKNSPIISDSEYDDIRKDLLLLETKYDFLKSKTSPSISVGYKPSKNFNKISLIHFYPFILSS